MSQTKCPNCGKVSKNSLYCDSCNYEFEHKKRQDILHSKIIIPFVKNTFASTLFYVLFITSIACFVFSFYNFIPFFNNLSDVTSKLSSNLPYIILFSAVNVLSIAVNIFMCSGLWLLHSYGVSEKDNSIENAKKGFLHLNWSIKLYLISVIPSCVLFIIYVYLNIDKPIDSNEVTALIVFSSIIVLILFSVVFYYLRLFRKVISTISNAALDGSSNKNGLKALAVINIILGVLSSIVLLYNFSTENILDSIAKLPNIILLFVLASVLNRYRYGLQQITSSKKA